MAVRRTTSDLGHFASAWRYAHHQRTKVTSFRTGRAIGLSVHWSLLLVHDHRSESLSDHRFGTADHLVDNTGRGHQPFGLTDGFAGQQAHLFEITRELWGWRKSTKPLHGHLLSIKAGLTNHRKLRIRNHPVWRRIVTPFPFPHNAVAQPARRSIGEFRTEDQVTGCILDASSDHALLVLRMGISLEARQQASPHPDRVRAECQRSSNGPTIGNAARSDDGHGRNGID